MYCLLTPYCDLITEIMLVFQKHTCCFQKILFPYLYRVCLFFINKHKLGLLAEQPDINNHTLWMLNNNGDNRMLWKYHITGFENSHPCRQVFINTKALVIVLQYFKNICFLYGLLNIASKSMNLICYDRCLEPERTLVLCCAA